MNLTNFFIKEEPVAGLSISDQAVRLVHLRKSKNNREEPRVFAVAEVALPVGTIVEGELINQKNLTAALKELRRKAGRGTRFVVVSLPDDLGYLKTFNFPKLVAGERLSDAMALATRYQLPSDQANSYSDWHKIESENETETLAAAASAPAVESYTGACEAAGLKPVAVEFQGLSLARGLPNQVGATDLLSMSGQTSASVYLIDRGDLRFLRSLPFSQVGKKDLPEEIRKIREAWEAVKNQIRTVSSPTLPNFAAKDPRLKAKPAAWLPALGAALRGITPRRDDHFISLMPIGTEAAYAYQKTVAIAEFFSGLTATLALFFATVFLGSWVLATNYEAKASEQLRRQNISAPKDSESLFERARQLEQLLINVRQIIARLPRWSSTLENIRRELPVGITVSSLTIGAPNSPITVTGIAASRDALKNLREVFSASELFTKVSLPATNLAEKSAIPFSLSFYLKNPNLVYVP